MKHYLLKIFLLLFMFDAGAQQSADTTVTVRYLDSLKREMAELKRSNNFLYWSYQEKANVNRIDTVFIRADSSIITFLLKDGKPLKRSFNILDKDKNIVKYTVHYYNGRGLVRYVEIWEVLVNDFFDAKLFSAERVIYNNLDRPSLSIKYLQSVHRTIRTEYMYDLHGKLQTNTIIIKNDALWYE